MPPLVPMHFGSLQPTGPVVYGQQTAGADVQQLDLLRSVGRWGGPVDAELEIAWSVEGPPVGGRPSYALDYKWLVWFGLFVESFDCVSLLFGLLLFGSNMWLSPFFSPPFTFYYCYQCTHRSPLVTSMME